MELHALRKGNILRQEAAISVSNKQLCAYRSIKSPNDSSPWATRRTFLAKPLRLRQGFVTEVSRTDSDQLEFLCNWSQRQTSVAKTNIFSRVLQVTLGKLSLRQGWA